MDDSNFNTTPHKGRLIRRATIVFFAGMAALTLFSNTIVNSSLPRVQVKNFESGIISRQIQTEGTVSASLQQTVNFGAARTVDRVLVEVGSPVLVGDVLATLKPTDGIELLEMEKALENAQIDLARMKDTAAQKTVPAAEKAVKVAEKAVATALKTITERETAVEDAKDALDKAINALWDTVEDKEEAVDDAIAALLTTLTTAQNNLEIAEAKLLDAQDILAAAILDNDSQQTIVEAQHAVEFAQANVTSAEDAVAAAQYDYDHPDQADTVEAAKDALKDAENAADKAEEAADDNEAVITAKENLELAKENYAIALESLTQAQADLAAAKKADAQAVKDRSREITKAENNLLIQKKKLEQFKATQDVNEIVANYAGRISKLALAPGGVINPAEAVATIDDANATYELRATLPAEQANVLVIGDRADVMMGNLGWAQAILREIREDKDQPGLIKQLIFDIDGEVTLGQQVTLSIYKMSRQYEIIVPNAAVRQDANGSFVLIMRQKNGPLGSRFTLERVSATVLESDSTRSAISATIDYGTPVVTAANKPVEAGSRVLPTK